MERWQRRAAGIALLCALIVVWWQPQQGTGGISPSQPASVARAPHALRTPLPRAGDPASLSGAVRDARGAPLAGARVCARCAACGWIEREAPICADSDASGSYALGGLEPAVYQVLASAAGFAPGVANGGAPVPLGAAEVRRDLDIVLAQQGAELSGVVLDALGGPVAAARVQAVQSDGRLRAIATESDEAGAFKLWAAPGPVALVASADGYGPARLQRVAPSRHVELVLTPGSSIEGRVVHADDGQPVAGIELRAQRMEEPALAWRQPAHSDEEGRFVLENLEPGKYGVRAFGPKHYGGSTTWVALGLAERRAGVTVVVSRASSVEGRVLDAATQTACPDGQVTLGPPAPSPFTRPGTAERIQQALAASAEAPVPVLSAPIERSGAVRFRGVPSGRYFVTVQCVGHTLQRGPELVEVGSDDMSGLDWRVTPGLAVAISVVDGSGQPLPAARAILVFPPAVSGGASPRMQLTMDGEGRRATPPSLYPGQYRVEPADGAPGDPVELTLREGMGTVPALLRLRGDASLIVSVQSPDGTPIDDLEVAARPARAPADVQPAERAESAQGADSAPPIDASTLFAVPLGMGRYQFSALRAGAYTVQADDRLNPTATLTHRGSTTIEVTAGRPRRVEVTLARDAAIRGRVVDAEGQPADHIWVYAEAETGDERARWLAGIQRMQGRGRAMTDDEGRFTLTQLARGVRFTLRAEPRVGQPETAQAVAAPSEIELVLRSSQAAGPTDKEKRYDEIEVARDDRSGAARGSGGGVWSR